MDPMIATMGTVLPAIGGGWQEMLGWALKLFLTAFAGALVLAAKDLGAKAGEYLRSLLKAHLHGRCAGVVEDAVMAAWSKLVPSFLAAASDGKITQAEWDKLKKEAADLAEERLTDLAGWNRTDGRKWIMQQVEVALGKLFGAAQARGLPSALNPFGPGPTDPATEE